MFAARGDDGRHSGDGDPETKSVQSVKFLLHRIYQKTGISNRASLVAALRTGNTHVPVLGQR